MCAQEHTIDITGTLFTFWHDELAHGGAWDIEKMNPGDNAGSLPGGPPSLACFKVEKRPQNREFDSEQ